jgi:ATP adenylyltransferase
MLNDALWAPWRIAYLKDLERKEAAASGAAPVAPGSSNFFVRYWETPERDRESFVVHRSEHGMILLNRYPYVNGHLLVALGEARPRLADYGAAQRAAFWTLIEQAMALAQATLDPQGLNMGINEGRAAGAGVPEHVHAHVVPRWNGDTNFMAAVGQVRIVPDALERMWQAYRASAQRLGL